MLRVPLEDIQTLPSSPDSGMLAEWQNLLPVIPSTLCPHHPIEITCVSIFTLEGVDHGAEVKPEPVTQPAKMK